MGSDKQAAECDVGLGLRIQQMTPSMPLRQQQQQLTSPGFGAGGGGLFDGSAFFRQGGNHAADDAYNIVGAETRNTMNYFNSDLPFQSQVPTRGPFSFTKAQWQELERQTVVYKFLSASIPVPPQLLMPINGTQINLAVSHPNRLLNFGLPSNGTDQEPWRCRRTDGKKWRCSRDVAPDQKYCERHAHKNRPRSRKHVELHTPNLTSAPSTSTGNKKNHQLDLKVSSKSVEPRSHIFNQNGPQLSSYPTLASYDQPRCSFDWFGKGNTTSGDRGSQLWTPIMQPEEGLAGSQSNNFFKHVSTCKRQKETPMSSNGLGMNLGAQGHNQNDPCGLLLGPKLAFLNDDLNLEQTEMPRGFIDAWSTADGGDSVCKVSHKFSDPSNKTHPISSLTLSMSGGNDANAEERHEHLGIGLMDAEQDSSGLKLQQPMVNWMSTEPWMGSTPGGPLAEALCLGISSNLKSVNAHQPSSPYGCSSNTANTKQQSSSDESSSHGL
uniref:Growth-regulating factor n=1 Tax=Kalanchoe fedtschenkoi TaxID=63787 RepID=A0A7N0TRH3_KALFE